MKNSLIVLNTAIIFVTCSSYVEEKVVVKRAPVVEKKVYVETRPVEEKVEVTTPHHYHHHVEIEVKH